MTNTLLSAINGWFAALLAVMIIITLLFAFILYIALKPVRKDEQGQAPSAQKALARRETELTVEMVELMKDAPNEAKRAELEHKMRDVKSAQKLVDELMGPEEPTAPEAKPAKPAAKQRNAAPKANGEQAKPVKQKPAQPAAEQPKVKPEAKPAAEQPKAKPAAKPAAEQPKVKPEAKPAADEAKKAPDAADAKNKE